MGVKDRLRFDAEAGAVFDGARRYVLMRPDVLMGAIRGLNDTVRAQVLAAWRLAAAEHGGESLRAYAQAEPGARARLPEITIEAARDLGWGRWRVTRAGGHWRLQVDGSPFAAGAGPCAEPVCAPIAGLFLALVRTVDDGGAREVTESTCVARGDAYCEFEVIGDGESG